MSITLIWLEFWKHIRFQYWEGHYVMFKFQREAGARQGGPVSVVLQNSTVWSCDNEAHPKILERMEPWTSIKKSWLLNIGTREHIYVTLLTLEGWRYSKSILFYHNPEIWEPGLQNIVFPTKHSGFCFDMNTPWYAQGVLIWDK